MRQIVVQGGGKPTLPPSDSRPKAALHEAGFPLWVLAAK